MRIALVALALGLTLWLASAVPAAPGPSYPIKPVAMIVGWPAGQAIDLVARALVEAARPYLPVYVVNRPGGAGTMGAAEVVLAKPDGYTIGMTAVAVMTVQPHLTDLPYKTPDDYRPVIKTGGHAVVFCVRTDARWRSMAELLEQARVSPGAVRVGSAGVGTIPHIDLEALTEKASVNLTHVPFAGAGEYVSALLGGHIEAVVGLPVEVIPHIRAGRMRALAIFAAKRNPLFPGVPIFPELGYDITAGVYHFVIVPKATPDRVVQILHDALKKALETEAFRRFAADNSYVIDYMGPSDLKRQLERDYAFFGDMVRKLKLR